MTGRLTVAALFAGIGGIEHGFHKAGLRTVLFSESDDQAAAVLGERFPTVELDRDVTALRALPKVDVVTAGFPCQDLSQAGGKKGIQGQKSRLVGHLFDLLRKAKGRGAPTWLVIENVPYMLSLNSGEAMSFLTSSLEHLGYTWAYRRLDARGFGVPQRRPRIILVASKTEDPRGVLFASDSGQIPVEDRLYYVDNRFLYGFYWTEGLRGIGWAESAVPPIKGGSGLGIPSAPAVWKPRSGEIGTIDIRDAERLQGLPEDWTACSATTDIPKAPRWRLIGNAVCSPVAEWVGRNLIEPGTPLLPWQKRRATDAWPHAAWGSRGRTWAVDASPWPEQHDYHHLSDFLKFPLKPLSVRASAGYLRRLRQCPYRVADQFIAAVEEHHSRMVSAA